MHSRELIDLAGSLALQAPLLINCPTAFRDHGIERYWVASKCRLDRWGMAIAKHATRGGDRGRSWQQLRPVAEEILVSEVLTRVWTAVSLAAVRDDSDAENEVGPVVMNVFASHLEASARVLKLLVEGQGLDVDQAVSMNRLRRRNERWNDLLLSLFAGYRDVGDFAYSTERLRDITGSADEGLADQGQRSALMASLRLAYRAGVSNITANAFSNRRIVASILACIGPDHFDSTGLPNSRFVATLYQTARDTDGMIEQLVPGSSNDRLKEGPLTIRRNDQFGRF